MTYPDISLSEFADLVMKNTKQILPPEMRNADARIVNVTKENNLRLTGLEIGEGSLRPIFYLNGYYNEALQLPGRWDDRAFNTAQKIMTECRKLGNQTIDMEKEIYDYETVKKTLSIRACDPKLNLDLVCDNVSRIEGDFAAIYTFKVTSPAGEDTVGTVKVTPDLLKIWDITPEELYRDASKNMMLDSYNVLKMPEGLMGMAGVIPLKESLGSDFGMMAAVTNRSGMYGANFIFIPEVLEEISKKVGGDYYLIPSSVHECIIVPGNIQEINPGISINTISDMIREVNMNSGAVSREEVLSNELQFFDSGKKKLVNAIQHELEKELNNKREKDGQSFGGGYRR